MYCQKENGNPNEYDSYLYDLDEESLLLFL
jgi:hypothetical protein